MAPLNDFALLTLKLSLRADSSAGLLSDAASLCGDLVEISVLPFDREYLPSFSGARLELDNLSERP